MSFSSGHKKDMKERIRKKQTNISVDIFLRWKNAVLQMLETCFSKERLLSKSMPRFPTDDEEFTEQPSRIRYVLHAKVFGPIINTSVFFRI